MIKRSVIRDGAVIRERTHVVGAVVEPNGIMKEEMDHAAIFHQQPKVLHASCWQV